MRGLRSSPLFHNVLLFAALVLLGAGLIFLNRMKLDRETSGEFKTVEATITGFGSTDSDASIPPGVFVSATSDDGLVGRRRVSPDRLSGCKIGDKIFAEKRGAYLKLTPSPCKASN